MLREALGQAQSFVNIIKDSVVAASSSAAAASSSASEEAAKAAASPSTTASSADAETSTDPLADLEEDSSSSTTTSTTETPTPSAEPWVSPYTEDDLKALTDTYESVNTWLETKLAEQEKLQPYEDPVFAPGELKKKAVELNDALMSLLQKKMKQQQQQQSKSSKTKPAPKPTKKAKPKPAKGEDKLKSVKDEIDDKVKSATEKIKAGAKAEFEIKGGKVASKEKDEL
jgi:hypoxia up-regulated 1